MASILTYLKTYAGKDLGGLMGGLGAKDLPILSASLFLPHGAANTYTVNLYQLVCLCLSQGNAFIGRALNGLKPSTALEWLALLVCLTMLTSLITISITGIQSALAVSSSKSGKRPPMLPYWIPIAGSIYPFLGDGLSLMRRFMQKYGYKVPAGLKLGTTTLYFVSDPQFAPIFFKPSPQMGANPVLLYFMQNVLGTPRRALPLYAEDNSGGHPTPFPGSCVEPENRIRFHHMQAAHKFLAGSHNGIQLSERYTDILRRNISANDTVQDDWIDYPDFYAFLRDMMFSASTEALCGSEILRLIPNLAQDFWTYDDHVPTLMKTPYRWLAPKAYKARDKMLDDIKLWHEHAKAHSDFTKIDPQDPDWEPYFGTKYVRARQKFFHDIKMMDANARAAEDVGLIFAASVNSIKVTFWVFFEVFTRPALLARVREIARLIHESSEGKESHTVARGNDPLLQSIFAEATRLRIAGIIGREVLGNDLTLGKWSIPKGSFIGLYSRSAGLNSDVWKTGTADDPHPVEAFWAERFLVYPKETRPSESRSSDPDGLKDEQRPHPKSRPCTPVLPEKSSAKPIFSTRGLNNVYVPFNGGTLACPGRQFARYEAINTLVEFALNFDIECKVPTTGWEPRMNGGFFPMGSLPPLDEGIIEAAYASD
ncbi:uncharacterized protein KY384_002320 [Bacidia gigantensis]|uniref:uncharacterized protein n=1 Tax=Bacidia gigantensis TaxID=2732470 RepID=UPI001D04D220|nr:uncharacterized protein KY384_002320 [Bacidia gigantensis]KAG8532443.1 hypothetical protein KY384_002320 [Bacidia gigantensis]